MGDTYWYARDDFDRTPSGPFHDDPGDVDVGEDERLRPIDASVMPDDGGGSETVDPEDMTHDELKAEAERQGVADEIDLRSKASIREALYGDE